jgi:ADP-ribosyl-[dinitrogen reductase] hydrolase
MTAWHIDSLYVPGYKAPIGLCACPGQSGSLENDLRGLRNWGAHGLLTLLEAPEMALLQVSSLGARTRAAGMRWWHSPIRDMQVPGADFEARWPAISLELRGLLDNGSAIAVHCHGGKGRTGTVAARLLVELGTAPAEAIERVRRARPGAIETREQERYVHTCVIAP